MALEFDSITTRGGDSGKSSLFGGERRYKSDEIFEVLGDIDELVSSMGIARAGLPNNEMARELQTLQKELQNISALIATPLASLNRIRPLSRNEEEWTVYLTESLERMELLQKKYMSGIEIRGFIIPGETMASARLDMSRTVCRRCERHFIRYMQSLDTAPYRKAQNYLNRLSDLLFVLARHLEQNA